jgi:hypothetical protein
MKIVGLCFVRARDVGAGVSFDTPLEGATLLERAVNALGQMPYADELHVFTDHEGLLARATVAGAKIASLPEWFFEFNVPFFSKEQWLLMRAMQALREAKALGEVLLVADWRTPLVSARMLETMYHKLMDDRVAARAVGTYPLDPNLFLRMSEETFFPAWSDIGADRQSIPQLYRSLSVGAVRPDRLVMPAPETRGVPVGREQGLRIRDEESLALARFYIQRRAAKAG